MKDTETFNKACEQGHRDERTFAALVARHGLQVATLSHGFRKSFEDIATYASDVDVDIEGYRCQYKHRHTWLWIFQKHQKDPIVDEVVKADRTPVDFYILRFSDGTLVVPYEPASWGVVFLWDSRDRAAKRFYTVDARDCIPLHVWIDSFFEEVT